MVKMRVARVHGPTIGEVQTTGQVDIALHPECVQGVWLTTTFEVFDAHRSYLHAWIL